MRAPKMVLFDYGQTLVDEYQGFNPLEGTRALLAYAAENPRHATAEEVQAFADQLLRDMGRARESGGLELLELHNHPFNRYLYEYFSVTFDLSPLQMERVFLDAAAPGIPTVHIGELLDTLGMLGVRTGVVSNISFSGELLAGRIGRILWQPFEFIIASSEYLFRKPHPRIFEIALRKAGLAAEDVWFCGDNPVCDIDGARGAGMQPIWYRGARREDDGLRPARPCPEIWDWAELKRLLLGLYEQGAARP